MSEKKTSNLGNILVIMAMGLLLPVFFICYPFWKLFSLVVNFVGFDGIRKRHGKIQTPVVCYENPETRRRIVFISTIHIAEPEYYSELQQLIDSLPDYKILFEGLQKLTHREKKALTDIERRKVKEAMYTFRAVRISGNTLNLQEQKDGLAYHANKGIWINSDIRFYELVRMFASRDVSLPKEKFLGSFTNDSAYKLMISWIENKALEQMIPATVLGGLISLFFRKIRLLKSIILDHRNKEAIRCVREHASEHNLAMIWGAGHLTGIGNLLKQDGYFEIDRQWFTAYTIRDYSFLKALKGIIMKEVG